LGDKMRSDMGLLDLDPGATRKKRVKSDDLGNDNGMTSDELGKGADATKMKSDKAGFPNDGDETKTKMSNADLVSEADEMRRKMRPAAALEHLSAEKTRTRSNNAATEPNRDERMRMRNDAALASAETWRRMNVAFAAMRRTKRIAADPGFPSEVLDRMRRADWASPSVTSSDTETRTTNCLDETAKMTTRSANETRTRNEMSAALASLSAVDETRRAALGLPDAETRRRMSADATSETSDAETTSEMSDAEMMSETSDDEMTSETSDETPGEARTSQELLDSVAGLGSVNELGEERER